VDLDRQLGLSWLIMTGPLCAMSPSRESHERAACLCFISQVVVYVSGGYICGVIAEKIHPESHAGRANRWRACYISVTNFRGGRVGRR
jgi:hypothetical protein